MKNFSRAKRAEQVEKMFDRYSCHYRLSIASTNSRYYSITAPDGEQITVRVADHADAYCTATFTVDPAIDQYPLVAEWVKAHGEKVAAVRNKAYSYMVGSKMVGHYQTKAEAVANPVEGGRLHYIVTGFGKNATAGWVPVEQPTRA